MNNKQKNSLEYSKPQLDEEFSDNTILDVLPQKIDEDSSSKYVLIKHDYYSSDSDHGRELLADFIKSLCDASYNSIVVYLIDKGTKLLDENNPLFDNMLCLINKSELVVATKESMDFYGIKSESDNKIVLQSSRSVAEELIYINDLLILG